MRAQNFSDACALILRDKDSGQLGFMGGMASSCGSLVLMSTSNAIMGYNKSQGVIKLMTKKRAIVW